MKEWKIIVSEKKDLIDKATHILTADKNEIRISMNGRTLEI